MTQRVFFEELFKEVFHGCLLTSEAMDKVHDFCVRIGLIRTSFYREFSIRVSWILARLAAKFVRVSEALLDFFTHFEKLHTEVDWKYSKPL